MNLWHRLFRRGATDDEQKDADVIDAKRRLMLLELKAKRRQALELDLKARRLK